MSCQGVRGTYFAGDKGVRVKVLVGGDSKGISDISQRADRTATCGQWALGVQHLEDRENGCRTKGPRPLKMAL